MSVFKKIMTSAAVMSLTVVPVAAHAADASKLSVARASTVSAKGKKNQLAGGGILIALVAAAAVAAGIVIVASTDDEADSN